MNHSAARTSTVARLLAAHFTRLEFEAIPPAQIEQLKRLVYDYLGIAVRGSQELTGRILQEFAADLGGVPQSSMIGRPGRVPAVNAAVANAVSEHSIELDDVDELALFHYGPPTVSTALAVAEWQGSTGREFLTALMAGCEMFARLSRGMNNRLRDRGFHTTPVLGAFAAAVVAGKLLRLDEEQMVSALGLAGAQASGVMEMYGPSMQKRFNPGPAARNGITAALLALRGFTGADTILDGERGVGAAFAGHLDVDEVLRGLGTEIPVVIEHKPYSAARPIHNGVDCALQVRQRPGFSADDIIGIRIGRHPDWADYHLNSAPATFHEAQVSLPYSVAVALVTGSALPDQYDQAHLDDERVQRLTRMVDVYVDPDLNRGVSCDMTVAFASGEEARVVIDDPKGSVGNPMTREDLQAKFRGLTMGLLPDDAAAQAQLVVDNLEAYDDVSELLAVVAVAPR
jgi:2-methylcitrate dehydratase PrpD